MADSNVQAQVISNSGHDDMIVSPAQSLRFSPSRLRICDLLFVEYAPMVMTCLVLTKADFIGI
jgi:hypothetical protein